MTGRLPKLLAALAVLLGVGAVVAGASVFVEAWQASRAWAGMPEAQHAIAPGEAPLWLDAPGGQLTTEQARPDARATGDGAAGDRGAGDRGVGGGRTSDARDGRTPEAGGGRTPDAGDGRPLDAGGLGAGAFGTGAINRAPTDVAGSVGARFIAPSPNQLPPNAPSSDPPVPHQSASHAPPPEQSPAATGGDIDPAAARAVRTAATSDVEVVETDFRFFDPPEPGARARLAVTVANHAGLPTLPLTVVLPTRWLTDFRVLGAIPAVLDDRASGEDRRQFVFPGIPPGERQTVELHLIAASEEVDGPEVRLLLGDSDEIGRMRPRTVAPRPRPGPARAVTIPKLAVTAPVVPVPWEPPPFVVGQLQGSAAVSEGNTVLIGHLAGPTGDVFARLDRLRPGDEVVATSRGLEYRFVVSEVAVRPYDDIGPTEGTTTPRLTLMTCTGQWSILRQDYSHRLWVIAEPPELAAKTIAANAEKAAQAAREAEAAAAARATHEAEAEVQPAPTVASATVTPPPTAQLPPTPVAPATATHAPAAPEAEPTVTAPSAVVSAPAPAMPPAASTPDTAPESVAPGIVIDAPVQGALVPTRLTVRGRRTLDADPVAPLWLLVRADLPGSRWYALERPLTVVQDGTWQAEIELGGAAGIRHEIRVGTVDASTDAALHRHAADRPGQPLDDLPPAFRTGARVSVERR